MKGDQIARGTRVFATIYQFVLGVDGDVQTFSAQLYGLLHDRLWESGWVKESTGEFQKASSVRELLEKHLEIDIPWTFAKLNMAVPFDTSKDKYTVKALNLFNQQILEETGKTPKQWYEGKVVESVPKARPNRRPTKEESVNSDNVRVTGYGNTREYRIAQLKKAGRDDLVKQIADGSLSANAAAIQAGLAKPPKPRPSTALEWLDYVGEALKTDTRTATLKELLNALPAEDFRDVESIPRIESPKEVTAKAVAQVAQVSVATVNRHTAVEKASPNLLALVESGKVGLKTAEAATRVVSGEVLQTATPDQVKAFAQAMDQRLEARCRKLEQAAKAVKEEWEFLAQLDPVPPEVRLALDGARFWLGQCR